MASEARKRIAATARSKIGWGYINGATGWVCTAARVEQQAKQYPAYADLIRKYGLGKWQGKRCVDCAQNTRLAAAAAGLTLPSGATSQWKADVWKRKGTIDSLPEDSEGLFLYRRDKSNAAVMAHTGVCLGGGKVSEARGHAYGVMESDLSAYPWTDWGELDESRASGAGVGGKTTDVEEETGMSIAAGTVCRVANLKDGTTKLNVRAAASATSTKVTVIAAGDSVTVLNDTGTWAKITTAAGLTGYCMSQYLQAEDDDAGTTTDDARLAALETSLTVLTARVDALEKAAGSGQADG